ncbi:MAG: hypothetical protein SNJ73_03575 [Acetobacteraceae bacterium]
MGWRAVTVHGIGEARAALAAARAAGVGVDLLSAPGAGGFAGAGWWLALTRRARSDVAEVPGTDVLDCDDEAGFAVEALRAGCAAVVFTGPSAQAERLAAIARSLGARLLRDRPPSLDLGRSSANRRLAAWLGATGGAPGDSGSGLL